MTQTFLNRRQLLMFSILGAALTAKPAWAGGLEHYQVTTPPQPMPNGLRFVTESGQEQTLADYRGRVVLLNVWATWCVPCVLEMPSLDRLQQQLGGPDFAVLPVSTDRGGAERVRRFYDKTGIATLPVLTESGLSFSRALAGEGLPLSLLIDRAGREIGRSLGDGDWAGPQALALVQSALAN